MVQRTHLFVASVLSSSRHWTAWRVTLLAHGRGFWVDKRKQLWISFQLGFFHTWFLTASGAVMCQEVEVGTWSEPWESASMFQWEIM